MTAICLAYSQYPIFHISVIVILLPILRKDTEGQRIYVTNPKSYHWEEES